MRTFKHCFVFSALLASCGGDPFMSFGDGGAGSGQSGASSGGSSGTGASGHGGKSGSSSGGSSGDAGSSTGGDAGSGIGGDAGSFSGASGTSSDASKDAPDGQAADARDSASDAQSDSPDTSDDVKPDVLDTECGGVGIKLIWYPPSLPSLLEITGAHASIGGLPLTYNACEQSDDLAPDPHQYVCCLTYTATTDTVYVDFTVSNDTRACDTDGCPAPLNQFEVRRGPVSDVNVAVTLENPSCIPASGTCQWILQFEP